MRVRFRLVHCSRSILHRIAATVFISHPQALLIMKNLIFAVIPLALGASAVTPCIVTEYASIASAVASCIDIVLSDIVAPASSSIDLSDLQDGATVTFDGTTVCIDQFRRVRCTDSNHLHIRLLRKLQTVALTPL